MTTRYQTGLVRRLVGAFALAGLVFALAACGGGNGGPGPFNELLIVTDTIAVTSYSVSNGTATERDTALIPGIPGTYSRSGNLVTITILHHSVPDGYWVDLDFSAGTGGSATDGQYIATVLDGDTFTITDTASGTITDGTVLQSPIVQGDTTYTQAGNVVTIPATQHGLETDDVVTLFFLSGGGTDGEYIVDSVPDPDTFTVLSPDSLTTSGNVEVAIGGDYTIFGLVMHPNGKWLYVTSTYAYDGGRYQWGSDLISRFAIDWDNGHLTFEKSFRTAIVDPNSTPAPVTLVISPDGMRMVHQDDDDDGLRLWNIDPVSGDLIQVAYSGDGTTNQHGLVFAEDGSRVYHGSRVFTVGASSITSGGTGQTGEANQIVNGTMFAIFGGQDGVIRAMSLIDPDVPTETATSDPTPNHARDLAFLDNGALIVASGFGGLKSYTYDGGAILPAAGVGDTEFIDGGGAWPADPFNDVLRVYRTISANAAGTVVASAYFTNKTESGGQGGPPSGFSIFSVAPDGSLALLHEYPGGNYARVARFIQKP